VSNTPIVQTGSRSCLGGITDVAWRAKRRALHKTHVVGYEGKGVRTIDSDPRALAIYRPEIVEGQALPNWRGGCSNLPGQVERTRERSSSPGQDFRNIHRKGPRECLEGRNVSEGTL